MKKVYQRINWENDPSTNTPINEDNLNKMDYALYELDKRVLTLGGYEERAALSATNAETSEINAKTSENNSKVSETNAKTSEINAKDYMERAYAATPEGYDELVETVRLMDIATTTESILEKSKHGGLKINHIKGATEQNGTPTPSNPIGIKNVGDCVEMIQGEYNAANGNYSLSTVRVCNKYPLPCKSGDTVKIVTEKTVGAIILLYYSESNFLSFEKVDNVSSVEKTVPSNATRFNFVVGNTTDTTTDTVGKISLTVNGKYVTPIKTHGKNELDCGGLVATTTNGVTFTPIYNSNGELEYINVNGTATADAIYLVKTQRLKAQETYTLNGCPSGGSDSGYYLGVWNSSWGRICTTYGGNNNLAAPSDEIIHCRISVKSGVVVNNLKFYPMIRKADITDDTYESYRETTTYIYTDEPIREGDVVFNDNGVWKVERNVSELVCDGDEGWKSNSDTSVFYVTQSNIKPIQSCVCDSYNNVHTNSGGLLCVNASDTTYTTLNDFVTSLSEKPITVQYKLATPTYETLDTASQIALNSIETFDTVTYIEVDSRVQPSEIEVEYGTSKVGGYSLEALRNSKNNEKAIEENMKAITSGEVVVEYESEDDFAGRSWINVVTLMAGEKLKNILNMISAMFNNIRFLRNEVNKKMDANYGYLTEGDLNNIIYESGKAYCTTNVANIPIMERGWLEVLMSDDADMVLQRYTTAVGNKVFIRRLVKSTSNGWGEWSKCNLTSDDIVVDMVAKPATMNLPAWASVSIEIESKYLSLEYELLSANVYFVDDLSSGTLSDSNLCVDQVMTSTNTASAHCCVAKVRNASSSQINKGCYSVARFVLVKK